MIEITTRLGRLGAIAALSALCAATAQAQVGGTSSDGYNIPEDIAILDESNPDNRQAVATVNGQIITGTDVEQRVALIMNATGSQATGDELKRLKLQILRALIDETLQIQDAEAQEMPVTQDEVDESYARIAAQRFNRSPEELTTYLESIGSSAASLKRQVRGELAWNRIIGRNISPFVNVSQEEANELYERLQESQGTSEYRIGEIYLSATSANREAVEAQARQIVEQLQQGGSFVAYARQYSEASTAAVGGDLGWIQLPQLQNPQLEAVAEGLEAGQLAGPIEIPGGFSILYMIDKRQIGMADPRDAVLSLKQISIDFEPGTTEEAAQARLAEFSQQLAQIGSCEQADSAAAAIDAEVVDNDQLVLRALPEALQATLMDMNVGDATPPFGSLEDGVRVLMLCGRQEPEEQAGPTPAQLMGQMEDERINRRGQRYMRDLRRDAVIDYN